MAEDSISGGGWRDSEEVRAAKADHTAKLDYMMVCCEVQAEAEAADEMDAETLQRARDNALFATAEYTRTLEALLDAVWASAVRGRAEQVKGDERMYITELSEQVRAGFELGMDHKAQDDALDMLCYMALRSRGAGGEDTLTAALTDRLLAREAVQSEMRAAGQRGELCRNDQMPSWDRYTKAEQRFYDLIAEQERAVASAPPALASAARSPSGPPQEAAQ